MGRNQGDECKEQTIHDISCISIHMGYSNKVGAIIVAALHGWTERRELPGWNLGRLEKQVM